MKALIKKAIDEQGLYYDVIEDQLSDDVLAIKLFKNIDMDIHLESFYSSLPRMGYKGYWREQENGEDFRIRVTEVIIKSENPILLVDENMDLAKLITQLIERR